MKFKKTLMVSLAAVLAASSVIGLTACGGGEGEGGGKGGGGKFTTINFWGGGDENETEVFNGLVKSFNAGIGQQKGIKVTYSSGHDDYDNIELQLTSATPPDVVYVPDRQFKKWASSLLISPLTNPQTGAPLYDGLEEFTAPGKIWDWGINRYRMDFNTSNSTPDATLWALPKDIGPSVLYYNRDYLTEMGITHLSLDAKEAKAAGYPEKGYFQHTDGKWYFNNRVPMSWEEVTDLGMKMQKEIKGYQANGHTFNCEYGYFTEWWFNYGYGVGGDVVEYIPEEPDSDGNPMGYYKFTLNDKTENWIVKDEETAGITVNGNKYGPGETISYTDKTSSAFNATLKAKCNQLPSMYDAFLEFCSLTALEGATVGTRTDGVTVVKGKQVSMGQTSIGQQSARDRFADGQIGMFVGLRSAVTYLRKKINDKQLWMKDNNSWDVAPLPVYKEYNTDGTVKVHGKQAGHSGSMGLAIAYGSKKKQAAWEFVKYVAGEEGQKAQSEAGFVIPNQISLANSEVFLQSNQAPKNSQVFIDAANYEQPADWWYLTNWNWIDDWADALNNRVREPKSQNPLTVEGLFEQFGQPTQEKLYQYTYSSHNPGAKPKS